MDSNKLTVLVVDDEQIVLDSVKKHLRKENYEVLTALTAQSALEVVGQDKVDIVLTDLMMPEMDGMELMAVIKETKPFIPVIMITGYATINSALQANQLGAFDYVAKPFTKAEIINVVKRASDLADAERKSRDKPEPEKKPEAEKVSDKFKVIGENTWIMQQENGQVRIGVERAFLVSFGVIQTVYLPDAGDSLRQGSVCFQVFSGDFRTQSLLSPLSGKVAKINEKVLNDPAIILVDPYGEGWLLCLDPVRFEEEVKVLGR